MRRLKYLILSSFLSAGIASPVLASSGVNSSSKSQAVAARAGDFPHQANKLLREIRSDAESAMNHAAILKTLTSQPDMTWFSSADELNHLRANINDMSAKLSRLEAIRAEAAPWQGAAIDSVAGMALAIADDANFAVDFANSHQHDLWNQTYIKYVDNIYGDAEGLTKVTAQAVREYRQG